MAGPGRHVFHGVVWIVVAVFAGLAAALVIDATRINSGYDTLVAHRVEVNERSRTCLMGVCRVYYDYRGDRFSAVMPLGQSTDFVVDPQDPTVRMSMIDFTGGPAGTAVDLVFAALLAAGAVLVAGAHLGGIRRRRRTTGPKPDPPRWRVTLAPEDDPVAAPFLGPEPAEPATVAPGQYLRLRPGEALDVVDRLPRHHAHQVQVLLGHGELLLDTPHQRHHFLVGATGGSGRSRARRLVVVDAHHRAEGHVNDSDRFLVVLDDGGRRIGRLDFSDQWEMSTDGLRRICRDAGLEFSVERYPSDRELLAARPQWITPQAELALEHPRGADIHDFGLALWLGTGIAVSLLGATGTVLIFVSPVRYVVLAIAFAGLLVAFAVSLWGTVTWHRHRHS